MPSLNAEAEGELATDLSAAQALCALYPEDAPHPLDVHDRLRERRTRLTERERAFLEGYYEIAKSALDARRAQEARERAEARSEGEAREDGAA
ncbi:MAG: hypothetical protein MUE69_33095 [Myxococcota bacterium]|jgi:hypothetical protein|nr:hypothetical protein [Myxococcota bacterium]